MGHADVIREGKYADDPNDVPVDKEDTIRQSKERKLNDFQEMTENLEHHYE